MPLPIDHHWVFSEGNIPRFHEGGLRPEHARGLTHPCAYYIEWDRWYFFNEQSQLWHACWPLDIPKHYQAELLLIR